MTMKLNIRLNYTVFDISEETIVLRSVRRLDDINVKYIANENRSLINKYILSTITKKNHFFSLSELTHEFPL